MNQFLSDAKRILSQTEIREMEPLAGHTTFRIGGPADVFCSPSEEELQQLLPLAEAYKMPVTIIGNGSNLLVGDRGVRGIVIEIGKAMSRISVCGNRITAQAGALLSRVAKKALEHSLTGMECLAGIPGSVGGAVVMNAGAYGGEIKDVLRACRFSQGTAQKERFVQKNWTCPIATALFPGRRILW